MAQAEAGMVRPYPVSGTRTTRPPDLAAHLSRNRRRHEFPLIGSEIIFAKIFRRYGDCWITELVWGRHGILRLSSVERGIAMAELDQGIDIDTDNASE
jgi:hypothetical protein